MDTPSPKAGLGMLGAGAAACAACCAGPVLGFLVATGLVSVLGAVAFGVVGLLVVVAFAALLWQRRRRRARACDTAPGPVHVGAPQLKSRARLANRDARAVT